MILYIGSEVGCNVCKRTALDWSNHATCRKTRFQAIEEEEASYRNESNSCIILYRLS
jgi:hypothetical protein